MSRGQSLTKWSGLLQLKQPYIDLRHTPARYVLQVLHGLVTCLPCGGLPYKDNVKAIKSRAGITKDNDDVEDYSIIIFP